MITRSLYALSLVVALGNLAVISGSYAQTNSDISSSTVSDIGEAFFEQYEARLNALLKTRREEEKQFVSEVVNLVQQESIPKQLVDSSWIWVRTRRPFTNHPFIYFERVLRLQAEKLEIEIPDFDREIYSRSSFRPQSPIR